MNFLRETSKVIERFRIAYPQYWMDMLVEDIIAKNGKESVQSINGKVLAILRHQGLEREVTIPGLGLWNRMGFVMGLTQPGKITIPGINLVTNDGDTYYAQSAGGETPDDDFDAAGAGLRLGDDNTSPTKSDTDVTSFLAGTGLDVDASYPQTDDGDSDNTGAAVDTLTWTYSYLTSEGNAVDIIEGAIVDDRTTPTAALTHFLFSGAYTKTSSDTLKVIVNSNFLGV